MWLREIPERDLETLWTILYLGADCPGVLPSWSARSVDLWHEVNLEVQRRMSENPGPPPTTVP